MRAGGGHEKGASFERTVCDELSRMVEPGTKETLFWRSAMSGGRATVRFKRGVKDNTQVGDITCVHAKGRWLTDNFALECKHYKNLAIKGAILNGTGELVKFWKEIVRVAKNHNKRPLLIARENRTKTLLFLDLRGVYTFRSHHRLPPPLAVCYQFGPKAVYVFDYKEIL